MVENKLPSDQEFIFGVDPDSTRAKRGRGYTRFSRVGWFIIGQSTVTTNRQGGGRESV